MGYELTKYGEEYLETGYKRLEKRREELEQRSFTGKRGGKRVPYDSAMYKLARRLEILGNIRRGQDPVGSFEFLPENWKKRKAKAYSTMQKELGSLVKANLVKETRQEESTYSISKNPAVGQGRSNQEEESWFPVEGGSQFLPGGRF